MWGAPAPPASARPPDTARATSRATVLTFVAPVRADRRDALVDALGRLREKVSTPPCAPFSNIPTLHFASVTLFDLPAPDDPAREVARGLAPLLVIEQNFDGRLDDYLPDLLKAAAPDLHALLRCCEGYEVESARALSAIAAYLRAHLVLPRAWHVGNVGRASMRVRRERTLREALGGQLGARLRARRERPGPDGRPSARLVHDLATEHARADDELAWVFLPHPRLTLAQRVLPWLRLVGVAAAAVAVVVRAVWELVEGRHGSHAPWRYWLALAVVGAIGLYLLALVSHEVEDHVLPAAPLDAERVRGLEAAEDEQLQNHLASITIVKPGAFRRLTLRLVLWLVNLRARTITNGRLSKIASIHFAHWSLLDGGRRLLFLSNYDGSWGSYLDDFVEKAATGLSAIWSNTVGFPRTGLLVFGGARHGVAFKAFARTSQTAAAVWYSAYPDTTVQQVDANSALREGLARRPREGAELEQWARGL